MRKKIPKKTFLQAKVKTCPPDRPPEARKSDGEGERIRGRRKIGYRGAHIIGFGHSSKSSIVVLVERIVEQVR